MNDENELIKKRMYTACLSKEELKMTIRRPNGYSLTRKDIEHTWGVSDDEDVDHLEYEMMLYSGYHRKPLKLIPGISKKQARELAKAIKKQIQRHDNSIPMIDLPPTECNEIPKAKIIELMNDDSMNEWKINFKPFTPPDQDHWLRKDYFDNDKQYIAIKGSHGYGKEHYRLMYEYLKEHPGMYSEAEEYASKKMKENGHITPTITEVKDND